MGAVDLGVKKVRARVGGRLAGQRNRLDSLVRDSLACLALDNGVERSGAAPVSPATGPRPPTVPPVDLPTWHHPPPHRFSGAFAGKANAERHHPSVAIAHLPAFPDAGAARIGRKAHWHLAGRESGTPQRSSTPG